MSARDEAVYSASASVEAALPQSVGAFLEQHDDVGWLWAFAPTSAPMVHKYTLVSLSGDQDY